MKFSISVYLTKHCAATQAHRTQAPNFWGSLNRSTLLAAHKRPCKLLGFYAVDSTGQTRNLARGLLPVHGALAGGLGKHGSGGHQSFTGLSLVAAGNGGTHLLDGVLDASAGGAVAAGSFYALPVTLDG